MKFLEKDLEEIIWKSNKERLAERGLIISGRLVRQFKIGNYGVADLVTFERPKYHKIYKEMVKGRITVYELKREDISVSAFFQAVRYVKGIMSYIDQHTNFSVCDFDYCITLIGSYDGKSDVVYLSDLFTYSNAELAGDGVANCEVRIMAYEFGLEGIFFEDLSGYKLTQEGFKK
jgi:hypothetical protein